MSICSDREKHGEFKEFNKNTENTETLDKEGKMNTFQVLSFGSTGGGGHLQNNVNFAHKTGGKIVNTGKNTGNFC